MAEKKKILYMQMFFFYQVDKCRIHNVFSFRGWHSEWNSGLQVHDSRPSREEYRIFHSREPTERSLKQSALSDTESAEAES